MKLNKLGEFGLIESIRARSKVTANVHRGIGDDAAEVEIPAGHRLLTSTDLLLEDVHFSWSWTEARELGRKAVAVNLSDIAAMGGTPCFLYLGLACPTDTEIAQVDAFVDGVLAEAAKFDVALVGGDTCRSPGPWIISVTIEGIAPTGKSVGRTGAQNGDLVVVSGTLGDSALALDLWQHGGSPEPFLAARHNCPTPRVALGHALAQAGIPTAMIDISDGLVSDLAHILDASEAGAVIHETAIPLSPEFLNRLEQKPERFVLALSGGEDYELLFALPPARLEEALAIATKSCVPLTQIGTITQPGTGLQLCDRHGMTRPLQLRGYEHFSSIYQGD